MTWIMLKVPLNPKHPINGNKRARMLKVKFQSDLDNTVLYSGWLSSTINTVKRLESEAHHVTSTSHRILN